MPDRQLESRIGMDLARRAYLYDLLHSVFGGNCSPDFVAKLFGSQAREMFACEATVISDGDLPVDSECALAKMDRSLDDCAREVLACYGEHGDLSSDAVAALASEMEGDYAKLFQIPGTAMFICGSRRTWAPSRRCSSAARSTFAQRIMLPV